MMLRASPDWTVSTTPRDQPPSTTRSNLSAYEVGEAYTALNTNRLARLKLERPHLCLGEFWSPRVKVFPAPVPLMLAPSVSNDFENVYDASNCSPRLYCFVRLVSRPLYQEFPAASTCCNAVDGMPGTGTRSPMFARVFSV